MRRTKEAFFWIITVLRKNKIPFQISSGFAAKLYGANRPLADIDIDIPYEKFKVIYPHVSKFLVFGPKRYKDANWDLQLMTLRYKGQEIDICGAGTESIFDKKTKKWIKHKIYFKEAEIKNVFGLKVPVISKKRLINYKELLCRRVDNFDVKALKSQ